MISDPKESPEYKEAVEKGINFRSQMLESMKKAQTLEKELAELKKSLEDERSAFGSGSIKLFTMKMTMLEFKQLLDVVKGTDVESIIKNARPMSI